MKEGIPRRVMLGAFALLGAACSEGLGPEVARLSLWTESGAELTDVPAVERLRLSGLSGVSLASIWLVQGEVSSVSQGRLRKGEVPQTVLDHRKPLVAYQEGEVIVLAPSEVLAPGEIYSLVALGVGLLGSFQVSKVEEPVLLRFGITTEESPWAVYCAGTPPYQLWDSSSAFDDPKIQADRLLEVGQGSAGIGALGLGSEHCVSFPIPTDSAHVFVPPPRIGDFLVDPAPVDMMPADFFREPEAPAMCKEAPSSTRFAGGCAFADGAAFTLSLSKQTWIGTLAEVNDPRTSTRTFLIDGVETTRLGPLRGGGEYVLRLARLQEPDVAHEVSLTAPEAAAQFVLTEILANPRGAEPQAEWVEVLNAGSKAGTLLGHTLRDSGGSTTLPDVTLEAGKYGLIVRRDFSFAEDEVPDPAAPPIFVEAIGTSGLRNSGEQVQLLDAEQRVVSAIPAMEAKEGISLARVSPWSPDGQEFFRHSDPEGNSPGYENTWSEVPPEP